MPLLIRLERSAGPLLWLAGCLTKLLGWFRMKEHWGGGGGGGEWVGVVGGGGGWAGWVVVVGGEQIRTCRTTGSSSVRHVGILLCPLFHGLTISHSFVCTYEEDPALVLSPASPL